jgi:altronate dehydratase
MTEAGWDAIAIDPRDDVAVLLRDVLAGTAVRVRVDGALETVLATDVIALGHKIARRHIKAGAHVRKYGESIASATVDISAGQHVHVHNVASNRARKREGSGR